MDTGPVPVMVNVALVSALLETELTPLVNQAPLQFATATLSFLQILSNPSSRVFAHPVETRRHWF